MNPTLDWLRDPEVFEVNRVPAHSDHIIGQRQLLNGTWAFAYSEYPGERPADFFRTDYALDDFGTIQVPGHIQLQGHGKPQYVNCQYPWEGHEQLVPPQIPEHNPVGSYVRCFDLEEKLLGGKHYFLRFEGAETAIYVWLNGHFVGYSEDSFTPSEFDVTPYIKETGNRLAVEVYRYSTASWLEDQDFWRFSGIFRDVLIYSAPEVYVRDIKVTADYDYERGKGMLSASADIAGEGEYSMAMELMQVQPSVTGFVHKWKGAEITAAELDVLPWSAEQPNLYGLAVQIFGADGKLIFTTATMVGFRTFEMKNGVMCLNGKRIIFKGVNRHEFSAGRGRAITKDDMLTDILTMKRNNINAVRTSHYPNNTLWYKLCDMHGIYVIDETNLETHGTWQVAAFQGRTEHILPGSVPEWKAVVLDRARSMYERDKNHPCVLMWSCGNESHCGDNIAAMADYFHSVDSRRLVHYEGVFHSRAYDHITDMESRMYAKPADIEKYLSSSPAKPYISCEYMHAMGNSLGGMSLYTDLEDKFEGYQGGFIWDYIDQALYMANGQGSRVLAVGGDFVDRPTNYGFCTNGIVTAERQESPKMQEVKALYSNLRMNIKDGMLTVENRNLFIDTSDYSFRVTLEKDGQTLAAGTHALTVQPGESITIPIGLSCPDQPGEYVFTASAVLSADTSWVKKGHEVAFAQEVMTVAGTQEDTTAPEARIVYGDFGIGLQGDGFSMHFDKEGGGLSSLVYDGVEYITRHPQVSFWRAPTDNDNGCGFPFDAAQWMAAGKYSRHREITTEERPGCLVVTFVYAAPTVPSFMYKVIYTAHFDGRLGVRVEYPGVAGLPDMPVMAMDFGLKSSYDSFTYYGMGPAENYIDRCQGAKLGVYSSTAADNLTGYLNPQECGNRTGVRYVCVNDAEGCGLRFSCVNAPFEMSVLPYSAYQLGEATHREHLPRPAHTWVRIAAKQMGVGGDDSWGAPVHEEYRIPAAEAMTLEFVIEKAKR